MMKSLGDFEVDFSEPLGSGGSGTVYKGYQISLNKRAVAIKILNKNITGRYSEEEINRFKREIEILSRLTSGQIVHIYGAGFDENEQLLWYAMELVNAKTLDEIIFEQELTYEDIIKISTGIARALQTALEVNIIHRDIKPSNIFVLPDKSVKLADFGLAKNPEVHHLTSPDTVIGTLDYISPERIEGKNETFKSDIYSLGAIMYEMAAKSPPFGNNLSAAELLYKHVHETAENLAISAPKIPKNLKKIIEECLEKNPSDRPESYSAIISRLEEVKKHLHTPAREKKIKISYLIIYPIMVFLASYTLFSLLHTFDDNNNEQVTELLRAPDPDSIEKILSTKNIIYYDDIKATSGLANKLYVNGDYLKAMILYYDLLDQYPDNRIYRQRLAHTLLFDNRFDDITSNPLLKDYHHLAKTIDSINRIPSNNPTLPQILKYVSTLIEYVNNEPSPLFDHEQNVEQSDEQASPLDQANVIEQDARQALTRYLHRLIVKVLLYCDEIKLNSLKNKYGSIIAGFLNNNNRNNPVDKLTSSVNKPLSKPEENTESTRTKVPDRNFTPYKTIEVEKKVEFLADDSIKGSYFAVVSLPPGKYSIVKGKISEQFILNKPFLITHDKIAIIVRTAPDNTAGIHLGYKQIQDLESLPMINGVTPYLSITDPNGITSIKLNIGNNNNDERITKHTLLEVYEKKKKVAVILRYSGLRETNNAFLELNSRIFNLYRGIQDCSLKLKIIPENPQPGRDIELHISNIQNHYNTLKLCRLSYEPKFFKIIKQTNVSFPLLVEFTMRDTVIVPGKSGTGVGRGKVAVVLE